MTHSFAHSLNLRTLTNSIQTYTHTLLIPLCSGKFFFVSVTCVKKNCPYEVTCVPNGSLIDSDVCHIWPSLFIMPVYALLGKFVWAANHSHELYLNWILRQKILYSFNCHLNTFKMSTSPIWMEPNWKANSTLGLTQEPVSDMSLAAGGMDLPPAPHPVCFLHSLQCPSCCSVRGMHVLLH